MTSHASLSQKSLTAEDGINLIGRGPRDYSDTSFVAAVKVLRWLVSGEASCFGDNELPGWLREEDEAGERANVSENGGPPAAAQGLFGKRLVAVAKWTTALSD